MADGEFISGADALAARLQALGNVTLRELEAALYQEGLAVEKLSRELTPVRLVLGGTLRASHVTARPVLSGSNLSVTITVGGPAAPYAVYVHENLDARHRVGQAKFLESAVLAFKPDFADDIARRIASMRAA